MYPWYTKYVCNHYLDLSNRDLPITLWETILQDLHEHRLPRNIRIEVMDLRGTTVGGESITKISLELDNIKVFE